jgi:hypothetical protein
MLMMDRKPKWIGWKVPGDLMIFWWPAETDARIAALFSDTPFW